MKGIICGRGHNILKFIARTLLLNLKFLSSLFRLKSSERLFIHKSLLLSLALGNLVYIMDKTLFDTREKHAVSKSSEKKYSILNLYWM